MSLSKFLPRVAWGVKIDHTRRAVVAAGRRGLTSAPSHVEGLEVRRHLTAVTGTAPLNGAVSVAGASNITVTFTVPMNPGTISSSTLRLRDASNNVIPSVVTYNASNRTATIDPTSNLPVSNGYFFVTVVGGESGVRDTGAIALPADYTFSFTTGTANFSQNAVWTGLTNPTAIEFAVDGRVFIAEKSGIIKQFDSLTDTTPTIVADFRTNVHNFWDRGLLGLALDPQFTTGRPFIYILYTHDADIGGTAPKWGTTTSISDSGGSSPTGTGVNVSGRLSKFTVGANNTIVGGETVLIEDWANQFPSHTIGDLDFGPDGALYASSGDGASFNTTDYGQLGGNPFNDPTNEGGALRSQDVRTTGDPTSLDGSIIRIHPDTGAAASGNPVNSNDANRNRIIAFGLRNPFRFAFRPGTSEMWIADVGWNAFEELNRLDTSGLTSQPNFGWPAYEGPNRQSGYDALNLPLLESLYTAGAGAVVTPFFAYSHSAKVVANSNEPTGGSSITGVAFYERGNYPAAFDGAVFFTDYSRRQIYVMHLGPDGQPNVNSRQIFLAPPQGAVQLKTGPGGDLFYIDLVGGRVVRVVNNNVGTNTAPTAVITSTARSGASPLTVDFNALSSTDLNPGDTLLYEWDLDGDGQYDDSTSATPSFTYTTPGNVTVRLRATDRASATGIANVVVSVANTAPVPVILSPTIDLRWSVGDQINFFGSATDNEEGILSATSLKWDLVLIHANDIDITSTHTHVIQSYESVSGGSFVAPDHEYPSWLELRLTATDSFGSSATTSMRVDPKTIQLSFNAVPGGLSLGFNGDLTVAPFTKTVIANSTNTISAPPQVVDGSEWVFQSWSNGRNATHNINAPQFDTTYTATFFVPVGEQRPFFGTPSVVPGRIEAEHYDIGPSGIAQFDNAPENSGGAFRLNEPVDVQVTEDRDGGGFNVGWIEPGEWIEYTINATQAGLYTLLLRLGSGQADAIFHIEIDGVDVTGPTLMPRTSWVDFTTLSKTGISLTQGEHVVRFYADSTSIGGLGNFNWMQFVKEEDLAPLAPTNTAAVALSATSARLTWTDNAFNETGYQIDRRYVDDTEWTTVAIVGRNAVAWEDTNLTYGTTYVYRVRAVRELLVTAQTVFSAYDLAVPVTTPTPTPLAPSNLTAVARSSTTVLLEWDPNTDDEDGFILQRRRLAPGAVTDWSTVATLPAGSLSFTNNGLLAGTTYSYRIRAIRAGLESVNSEPADVTTWAGGNGLTGVYYDNADFTGTSFTRVDPKVDFAWRARSPGGGLGADTFSVRWTGRIQATFSETHNIIVRSDEGVRLWIDNNLVIDKWQVQTVRNWSALVPMQSGQFYNIRMDYFDNTGDAIARLQWSSPSTPKSAIPSANLFSTTTVAPSATSFGTSSSTLLVGKTSGATSSLWSSNDVI